MRLYITHKQKQKQSQTAICLGFLLELDCRLPTLTFSKV